MNNDTIINLALRGVFSALGFILNIVTIIIIARGLKFGKGMKIQLMNLAVCDLIFSLIVPGVGLLEGIIPIPFAISHILCKAQHFLTATILFASLLSKTFICIEKLIAVFFPLKMLHFRRPHIVGVVILIWVLTLAVSSYMLFDATQSESDVYLTTNVSAFVECNTITSLLTESEYEAWVTIFAIRFIVPSAVILIVYSSICAKLVRRKRVGERHRYNSPGISRQVWRSLSVTILFS